MLSRLQQILGAPPSRPGGGAGTAGNPSRPPLPATLLPAALAYPALVSTAPERDQAQEHRPQQRQLQAEQEQPRQRVMPASVPAHAVRHPRTSGQPAGGRGGQQPQGGASRSAAHEPSCAATPAAVRSAQAASGSVGQSRQDAASARHPAVATHAIRPPPDRSSDQPAHAPAAAAWHAPSQPVSATRAPNDAYESGEETEDEAWMPPPAKRQRRRTAAAAVGLALRQQHANKASECDPSP